ncbi:MAG: glycosyltransferase family 4 protein [Bacteroidetes bacterium]|nr:glycosyltransferase family 4 protein [Bacteroidota bacterium]
MQELAEELQRRQHEVIVITCYPQYNLASNIREISYPVFAVENGIQVIRVRTLPHHKVNFILRGISQLIIPYAFIQKIKKYVYKAIDAVIVYSPPLTLWKVGLYMKERFNAKFILNVQDVFPQNAIDLGVLKSRFLIRYFERIELKAYEAADIITVHSEGNAQLLLMKQKVHPDKLHILHNWIDIDTFSHKLGSSYFRQTYNLNEKFLVFFGGVLGPSQGLEFLIEVAKNVQNYPDILFIIFGDGTEKGKLLGLKEKFKLQNIEFYPFVTKEEYVQIVQEVDIGLVCLSPLNKTPVVPGKILSYMAAGIPILAFLNKESDGHEIIRQSKCGLSCVSDNVEEATSLLLKLFNDRAQLSIMGENGFKYALQHFSKEVCINKLEQLLYSNK